MSDEAPVDDEPTALTSDLPDDGNQLAEPEVEAKPKRKVNRGRADLSSSVYEEIHDATNTGQAHQTDPSGTNPHKPPAQMFFPDGDPEWGHLPVQMRHNPDGTPAF